MTQKSKISGNSIGYGPERKIASASCTRFSIDNGSSIIRAGG